LYFDEKELNISNFSLIDKSIVFFLIDNNYFMADYEQLLDEVFVCHVQNNQGRGNSFLFLIFFTEVPVKEFLCYFGGSFRAFAVVVYQ